MSTVRGDGEACSDRPPLSATLGPPDVFPVPAVCPCSLCFPNSFRLSVTVLCLETRDIHSDWCADSRGNAMCCSLLLKLSRY